MRLHSNFLAFLCCSPDLVHESPLIPRVIYKLNVAGDMKRFGLFIGSSCSVSSREIKISAVLFTPLIGRYCLWHGTVMTEVNSILQIHRV